MAHMDAHTRREQLNDLVERTEILQTYKLAQLDFTSRHRYQSHRLQPLLSWLGRIDYCYPETRE